jgi:hypothetical protein
MQDQDSRSRKWQVTINNPLEKGHTHEKIKEILSQFDSVQYWCLADEIGENGTYHSHVYLAVSNAIRFSTMKKRFEGAHFEIARGTSAQNRDYVFKLGKWINDKKKETNLENTHEEWGQLPVERQGARNDLADLYDMIKQGMDNYEILENTPEQMLNIDRIDRARQVIREKAYRKVFRKLTVTYIFGSTGLGKTRYVMEKHEYDVYRVTGYKHPFDGYRGQSVICFEEFRSSLEIQDMLTLLDGYNVELPCRYSNKIACYETVYIISNIPLKAQYTGTQFSEPETFRAFLRRISSTLEFHSDGTVTELTL